MTSYWATPPLFFVTSNCCWDDGAGFGCKVRIIVTSLPVDAFPLWSSSNSVWIPAWNPDWRSLEINRITSVLKANRRTRNSDQTQGFWSGEGRRQTLKSDFLILGLQLQPLWFYVRPLGSFWPRIFSSAKIMHFFSKICKDLRGICVLRSREKCSRLFFMSRKEWIVKWEETLPDDAPSKTQPQPDVVELSGDDCRVEMDLSCPKGVGTLATNWNWLGKLL